MTTGKLLAPPSGRGQTERQRAGVPADGDRKSNSFVIPVIFIMKTDRAVSQLNYYLYESSYCNINFDYRGFIPRASFLPSQIGVRRELGK